MRTASRPHRKDIPAPADLTTCEQLFAHAPDADQQAIYPGDRAFEYVVDQSDKPVVWPSREYFFQ